MPKKAKQQLELFAAAGNARALGLLGWDDPLWTTRWKLKLLDGTELPMDLITIRCPYLRAPKTVVARTIAATAGSAETKRTPL